MQDKIPHQAPAALAGLTPSQQRDVERARELLAAIDGGRETLTAHVVAVAEHLYQLTGLTLSDRRRESMTENPYPEATGTPRRRSGICLRSSTA
jgi:hypothetical protein